MKKAIFSIVLSFLLVACAGSPFRTQIEAEQNRANLIKINLGMTKDQVLLVMGQPYKTEMYMVNDTPLEFWLYLTEGKSIQDPRLLDSNFTPLAFEKGILKGWGRNYYDNALHIKKDITIDNK